jgi:hypothetical protein
MVWVLIVIGLLVPATAAQAAPFPPHLNLAYELAVGYWGQEPSACSTIDKEVVPHGGLGSLETAPIVGLATQVPVAAPAGSLSCILWIDRSYAQPVVFSGLCALMIHEVGHLLGMAHSPDPANVMNVNPPIPPLCRSKGRELTRVLILRRRLRRLRADHSHELTNIRRRTRRRLTIEAANFWALGWVTYERSGSA